MLHMTVVANLMIAIGLKPDVKAAVPSYPYSMSDILHNPLELNLESFSDDLVKNTFMQIEAPEYPNEYKVYEAALGKGDEVPPITIGMFYGKIIKIIEDDKIPGLFKEAEGSAAKQIAVKMRFKRIKYEKDEKARDYPLGDDIDFIITNKKSALRHLGWLVSEGEGAEPLDPLDDEGLPGHYYRFQSILKRKYLVKDGETYSFSGGKLPFEKSGVVEFKNNVKAKDFSGTVKEAMDEFNKTYSEMVICLDEAFNPENDCRREEYEEAKKKMFDLDIRVRSIIEASLVGETASHDEKNVGVPFEFKNRSC
jgi:hypothetical protein